MPPRKAKPKPWGIHAFLNEAWQEDKGYIKGIITWPSWRVGRPSIELSVADCDRRITLDFDVQEDADVASRIVKVERLRDTINAFCREALKALRSVEEEKREVKS